MEKLIWLTFSFPRFEACKYFLRAFFGKSARALGIQLFARNQRGGGQGAEDVRWLSTHYLPHKKSTTNPVSNCRAAGVGGSSSFLTFLLTTGSDGAGCLGSQQHWAVLRERDFEYLQGWVLLWHQVFKEFLYLNKISCI